MQLIEFWPPLLLSILTICFLFTFIPFQSTPFSPATLRRYTTVTGEKFKRPIIPRWLLGEPTESPKASEVVSRGCKQGLWQRAGQARRCREPSTALPTNSLCIRQWLEYSLCHLITTWQQPLLIPGGQRVNVYSISPGWKAGGKWFKHTSQPVKLRPATEWD